METNLTEKTLTSDWDEPGEAGAPSALDSGAVLGPFVIGNLLGRGGMGVVYSAMHRDTGAEFALKTLHRVDMRAVTRLKSEFRHLARIRHPHLVQLYELHTIGRSCFLTMERIDGSSIKAHLATHPSGTPGYYEAVRDVFRQVSEGLGALHEQGLLHLDLKPDNVMVDRQGRAIILDFGLVSPLHRGVAQKQRGVGGTPRYMAPERLDHGEESTHSDWFSFGVMLAELLVENPNAPYREFVFSRDAPRDLLALCRALLDPDRMKRPNDAAVARALGAHRSGKYRTRWKEAPSPKPLSIVGRDAEIARLEEGLSKAWNGETCWIRLEGESGIGKTALLSQFRARLGAEPDVLVLEGTCHERESMPFQGLDGILDDLARTLSSHDPPAKPDPRLLVRASLLCDAFSYLFPPETHEAFPRDPLEQRRAAFSAIKELLTQVTRTRTVVMLLDDVQWGDRDGARLLAEVLAAPSPTRLLVVTTSRTASGQTPVFLDEAHEILRVRGSAIAESVLELGRLASPELAECVPSIVGNASAKQREAIVRASGGLPYLATALGSQVWEENETPSLSTLIERRLADAPNGAREVLMAVSLSPSPLHQAVALEQVENASLRGAVLAALRNSNLVRTSGITPDSPLEPYHSLIADTIRARLPSSIQRTIRGQIAASLEEKSLATAEQLAHLYHLARENGHAARWAPLAAREAERTLAFESAAHWYGRASMWSPHRAREFLPYRARCLEYSGRSAEAAAAFEECARLTTKHRSEFLRSAGSAWLSSGHVDRGLSVFTPELKTLGTPVPPSERAALVRALGLMFKLWVRGTRYCPLPEEECDPDQLGRIDAIWHAAKGLGAPFPLRGLVLQLECLVASLEAGERVRIARSLAVLGPMFVGTPWESMGKSWTNEAHQLSKMEKSKYLRGVLLTFDAVRLTAEWAPPARILETAAQAFELLKEERGPIVWEQSMAFTAGLRVREQLGLFEDLGNLGTLWLAESTSRGDLFALAMACQACAMNSLAVGRVEAARDFSQRSIQSWTQGSYTVQHYYALRFDVQCDLSLGRYEDARNKLLQQWSSIRRAQLLRHPISRPEILHLRAVAELGALRGRTATRALSRMMSALANDGSPIARPHAAALRCSLAFLQGRLADARDCYAIAREQYEMIGQVVHARCLALSFGLAEDDTATVEATREKLFASGISKPDHYARVHAPPFVRLREE